MPCTHTKKCLLELIVNILNIDFLESVAKQLFFSAYNHIQYHHLNRIEILFSVCRMLNIDWRIDICIQKSFYIYPFSKKFQPLNKPPIDMYE